MKKAISKNTTDTISHSISQVKDFTKGIGKKIRDYELPGFEFVTNNGVKLSDNKTVGKNEEKQFKGFTFC